MAFASVRYIRIKQNREAERKRRGQIKMGKRRNRNEEIERTYISASNMLRILRQGVGL